MAFLKFLPHLELWDWDESLLNLSHGKSLQHPPEFACKVVRVFVYDFTGQTIIVAKGQIKKLTPLKGRVGTWCRGRLIQNYGLQ